MVKCQWKSDTMKTSNDLKCQKLNVDIPLCIYFNLTKWNCCCNIIFCTTFSFQNSIETTTNHFYNVLLSKYMFYGAAWHIDKGSNRVSSKMMGTWDLKSKRFLLLWLIGCNMHSSNCYSDELNYDGWYERRWHCLNWFDVPMSLACLLDSFPTVSNSQLKRNSS